MATAPAASRPPRVTLRVARSTLRPTDERVFATSASVVALDAALGGISRLADAQLAAGAAVLVVAVLAPAALVTAFVRAGRALRAGIALLAGLFVVVAELAARVTPALVMGLRSLDVVGILATLAGIVLLVLGFRIALRGRRPAIQIPVGILAAFLTLQLGLLPAIGAGYATSAPSDDVPRAASLGVAGARDVSIVAADGTRLAAWLVPGTNGAGVVLLHGAHASRADVVDHLRVLVAAGYAVVAVDARGHGRSEGRAHALGWRGAADVDAAARFLVNHAGVRPERVGAVGLSMGGEEALRAAATSGLLRAVVADGAGAGTFGDQRLAQHGVGDAAALVTGWLLLRETELVGGTAEPPPLRALVARIDAAVLLISSSAGHERTIDDAYARRIGPRAQRWHVADAPHIGALDVHRAAYAARLDAFLADALG
jgi:uncharacterized protein